MNLHVTTDGDTIRVTERTMSWGQLWSWSPYHGWLRRNRGGLRGDASSYSNYLVDWTKVP